MSNVDYYESQGFTREEAKRQVASDRASAHLIGLLFQWIFKFFLLLFLFAPGIFCAYVILEALKGRLTDLKGWNYFFALVGTVYVVECLFFLLKGFYIALREKGNGIWMVLWFICFLYCFALPVLMAHAIIIFQFRRPVPTTGFVIGCWIGAMALGFLIFRRYQLDRDYAPDWMYWVYRLGRK